MLGPYQGALDLFPVSTAVNSDRVDEAQCLARVGAAG
jgi:hypothetical protein